MSDDRTLIWSLLALGLKNAPALRREILSHHNTNELYIWRVQAATLIEEVTGTLLERESSDSIKGTVDVDPPVTEDEES